MSHENEKSSGLIISENRALSPRSTNLVRRGLDYIANRPPSFPAFDDDTYAKVKPFFIAGVADFILEGKSTGDSLRALMRYLKEDKGFPPEKMAAMRPYVIRFAQDLQAGKTALSAGKAADAKNPLDREEATDGLEKAQPAPQPSPIQYDPWQHLRELAEDLQLAKSIINSLGMEFILIPKGRFMMGSYSKHPSQKSMNCNDTFITSS
ncbi:MAG: hypothetical protein ACR2HX_22890 [Pyrinomonadaceae bacterium]